MKFWNYPDTFIRFIQTFINLYLIVEKYREGLNLAKMAMTSVWGKNSSDLLWLSAFSKSADPLWGIFLKITVCGFNFVFGDVNMNLSVMSLFCPGLRLPAGKTLQSAEWSAPALEQLAGWPQLRPPSRSHLVRKFEGRSAMSDTPLRELSEFAPNLGEVKVLIYLKFLWC